MHCPTCHAELDAGQQFCIQCGANVAALTLPAPPAGPLPTAPATVPIQVPPPPVPPEPPVPPIASAAPAPPASPASPPRSPAPDAFAPPTQAIPPPPGATKAFSIVEQTGHQDAAAPVEANEPTGRFGTTSAGPVTEAVPYPIGYAPATTRRAGRGSTPLAVLSSIAGISAAVAAFVPILRVRTDAPIVDVGVYKSNDLYLGTNLLIALLVAAACLIGGGLLAVFGRRLGAGLAAGAGLSLVPIVIIMYGATDMISRRAEHNAIEVASGGGGGTFFQTRLEAGLWILVGAAAIGLIVFVLSLLQAGGDGRPRIHIAIAIFGAVAALAAVAGQMIPGDYTDFAGNFNSTIGNHPLVDGRLGLMAVVAICGVAGFLCRNRWGVGLALGGVAIWAWQWLSSVTEVGDTSVPPGFLPFGSNGDLKPHIVTTIGVVGVLVMAVIALLTPQPHRR